MNLSSAAFTLRSVCIYLANNEYVCPFPSLQYLHLSAVSFTSHVTISSCMYFFFSSRHFPLFFLFLSLPLLPLEKHDAWQFKCMLLYFYVTPSCDDLHVFFLLNVSCSSSACVPPSFRQCRKVLMPSSFLYVTFAAHFRCSFPCIILGNLPFLSLPFLHPFPPLTNNTGSSQVTYSCVCLINSTWRWEAEC